MDGWKEGWNDRKMGETEGKKQGKWTTTLKRRGLQPSTS